MTTVSFDDHIISRCFEAAKCELSHLALSALHGLYVQHPLGFRFQVYEQVMQRHYLSTQHHLTLRLVGSSRKDQLVQGLQTHCQQVVRKEMEGLYQSLLLDVGQDAVQLAHSLFSQHQRHPFHQVSEWEGLVIAGRLPEVQEVWQNALVCVSEEVFQRVLWAHAGWMLPEVPPHIINSTQKVLPSNVFETVQESDLAVMLKNAIFELIQQSMQRLEEEVSQQIQLPPPAAAAATKKTAASKTATTQSATAKKSTPSVKGSVAKAKNNSSDPFEETDAQRRAREASVFMEKFVKPSNTKSKKSKEHDEDEDDDDDYFQESEESSEAAGPAIKKKENKAKKVAEPKRSVAPRGKPSSSSGSSDVIAEKKAVSKMTKKRRIEEVEIEVDNNNDHGEDEEDNIPIIYEHTVIEEPRKIVTTKKSTIKSPGADTSNVLEEAKAEAKRALEQRTNASIQKIGNTTKSIKQTPNRRKSL